MLEHIYTLTSIWTGNEQVRRCDRTWGWYRTEEEARDAAGHNDGDMHECLYNYMVLERVPWGGLPVSDQIQWYVWDCCMKAWSLCDQPPFAEGVVNFSLG